MEVKNVNRVLRYDSAFALISEERPGCIDRLDSGRKDALVHFAEWDSLSFCVLFDGRNENVLVLDSLNGDVLGDFLSIDAFVTETMREIEQDMEN